MMQNQGILQKIEGAGSRRFDAEGAVMLQKRGILKVKVKKKEELKIEGESLKK